MSDPGKRGSARGGGTARGATPDWVGPAGYPARPAEPTGYRAGPAPEPTGFGLPPRAGRFLEFGGAPPGEPARPAQVARVRLHACMMAMRFPGWPPSSRTRCTGTDLAARRAAPRGQRQPSSARRAKRPAAAHRPVALGGPRSRVASDRLGTPCPRREPPGWELIAWGGRTALVCGSKPGRRPGHPHARCRRLNTTGPLFPWWPARNWTMVRHRLDSAVGRATSVLDGQPGPGAL